VASDRDRVHAAMRLEALGIRELSNFLAEAGINGVRR